MAARVALYYAPLPADPLTALSSAWLGRDPVTNAPVAQPAIEGIAEVTAEPRAYGFHATLKPPMRLADGKDWFGFMAAIRAMAARIASFDLPPMAVHDLRGFLALRETEPSVELQALADVCVEELDEFRAPPPAEELARRRKAPLSAEQDSMLVRWGYPYVFGTWFFHMTLTRRLNEAELARFRPAAEDWFAPRTRRTAAGGGRLCFHPGCARGGLRAGGAGSPAGVALNRFTAATNAAAALSGVSSFTMVTTSISLGGETIRAMRPATFSAVSRPRAARRRRRVSGGAVISITRSGNRAAASAITPREILAITVTPRDRSGTMVSGMP